MLDNQMIWLLVQGIGETLYMTLGATLFSYVIGLPLGVILVVCAKDGIKPCLPVYRVLDVVVNLTRSIPFLVLAVWIIPFTRLITGTSIGSTAMIVPLVLAAAPFVARLVESSLLELDKGIIEAAQSMGASNFQIIWKVMLSESKPSLLNGATIAVTTILGYSAMGGFVGAGGLGAIAYNYGYYRYQTDIMLITVILLVIIVQVMQGSGNKLTLHADKRKI